MQGYDFHGCCCSVTKSCPAFTTPWTAAHQASLSFTISWSLLQFMSIETAMPSNHLILCFLSFPASGSFSNELAVHIRWPEYWSFSISPSNEYSGLISNLTIRIRIDWFDLLAGWMQGCHVCEYWFVKNPVSIKCSKAMCDSMPVPVMMISARSQKQNLL